MIKIVKLGNSFNTLAWSSGSDLVLLTYPKYRTRGQRFGFVSLYYLQGELLAG